MAQGALDLAAIVTLRRTHGGEAGATEVTALLEAAHG